MPPHNPVGPATIAQYVKLFLNLAEIDVSVYTLHSTKISSSTKVKNLGLRLKDIQKTVGWSQKILSVSCINYLSKIIMVLPYYWDIQSHNNKFVEQLYPDNER